MPILKSASKSGNAVALTLRLPFGSCEQVRRMDGFREHFKVVAERAGVLKEIGGCGLPGKLEHLAIRAMLAQLNGRLDSRKQRHHYI
jgi:hypothetical protein